MEAIAELINLPLLISSLVGFLVLYFVLKKFLWGSVLGIIDERRASIEAAFQEVDDAKAEIEQMKNEYRQELAGIEAKTQAKLQEAVERGQQVAAELLEAAKKASERDVAKAQEEIARDKDRALAELRNATIDLSFNIAQRVMREDLDRERHDRLVRSFIDDLKGLN